MLENPIGPGFQKHCNGSTITLQVTNAHSVFSSNLNITLYHTQAWMITKCIKKTSTLECWQITSAMIAQPQLTEWTAMVLGGHEY